MTNKLIDNVCAVRDNVVGAYLPPFICDSTARAIRDFGDACTNSDSPVHKHADDYSLEHLGYFDRESGEFFPLRPEDKRILAHGRDFLKKDN